jgi:outer membrane protein assembly factor BamA
MIWKVKKYCLFITMALFYFVADAQVPLKDPATDSLNVAGKNEKYIYIIGDIHINGNRKTRSYIIERELSFKRGDSIYMSDIVQTFVQAKQRLINTRLFNDVIISLKGFRGFFVDIQIDVKERWYIFPLPYVRPVDRNLTAWADQHFSLSRLDYGLKYSQHNFTGRNDNLRVWLISGYSNQVEFSYDLPYGDKSLKHGFGGGFFYNGLTELNAATINNKQYFINSDTIPYAGKYLREQWNFSLRYNYRPGIRTRHFVRFAFNKLNIDSAVTLVTPYYFNNNKLSVSYPELSYVLNYNNVDYVPYPLKGVLFETGILHRGINADMNMTQLYVKTSEGVPIARKTNFVSQNYTVIRVPFDQPFYNQQMLGYGDFYMHGFEKYVVDGVAGFLARNTLLRQLWDFKIPFLRGTTHDVIPLRIFAKAYFDFGYVYNKNFTANSLVNRALYSGGIGIDMVTFYDFVFRFEYSINQLGEKGLFFHIRNDF